MENKSIQHQNIRKVVRQGKQVLVTLPKELFTVGTFVRITPLEFSEKKNEVAQS